MGQRPETDNQARQALKLIWANLDADLHCLGEQMNIFLIPKSVKCYLARPKLILDLKLEKSVREMRDGAETCADCSSRIKTCESELREAHADD